MNDKMIKPLSYYDESYKYRGYVLVNELFEDSEGFYKNGWQWGRLDDSETKVCFPDILTGIRSNSYSDFSEAHKVFTQLIDKIYEKSSN